MFSNKEIVRGIGFLLDVFLGKTDDKTDLALKSTAYAFGNILRGWVINVQDNHDGAKDAGILLDGFKGKIKSKLVVELKSLKGIRSLKPNFPSRKLKVKMRLSMHISTTKRRRLQTKST